MGMKVIFLDADGVLNCDSTRTLIPGTRFIGLDADMIKRLKSIIKRTGASIVMSSTWRKHPECMEYLKKELGKKVSDKIIGYTPVLQWEPRWKEIDAWMARHPEVSSFIVLDDLEFEGLEKYGERFVLTHWISGLTDELTEKCIKLLGEVDAKDD